MFLIEEVGHALIVVEIITCFESNLALELAYLISSKDLFMPSIMSFCVMASLVGNTLSSVLTLIFGLARNFSITIFLLLGPRQVASSLHTKFAQLLATFHCSCSSMGGLGCTKDVVSIYSLIKLL